MAWLLEKDGELLLWLQEAFSHPILDKFMIFISALGDKGFFWIAIGVIFLLLGLKNRGWLNRGLLVLLSLGLNALFCNILLKPMVNRTRPYDLYEYIPMIPPVGDPSFPSGHTSASFAAATALYAMDRKWGIAAYIFAAVMGFSRLYVGVHFPTDVLAGAALGVAAAKFVIKMFKKRMKKSLF